MLPVKSISTMLSGDTPHNGSYFIDSSNDINFIKTAVHASLDTFFMTKVAGNLKLSFNSLATPS